MATKKTAGKGKKLARAKSAPSPTADALRKALALIRKGWIGWLSDGRMVPMAVDGRGRQVEPENRRACRFCSLGALERVVGREETLTHPAYYAIREVIGGRGFSVGAWNDAPGRKKSEVIAAFKKAIRLAEASR